jgi:hypothetical protein
MRVDLTAHARERMAQRGIAEHRVRKAIRKRFRARSNGGYDVYQRGGLEVVTRDDAPDRVITTYRTEFA